MDYFYAAVEERENPALRGRPLGVGGASSGRGVLTTCNYAARAFGVHSGAHGVIPRNTPPNLSLVGAMSKDGILCSMELEGAIDGDAFLVFIEQVLGPRLRRGDFVVLDNLNTHCSLRVEAAIYARGAFLFFLPRYSPDMNPIEKAWSKLKSFLRGVAARTGAALHAALAEGLQTITPTDARGWFKHAGYQLR